MLADQTNIFNLLTDMRGPADSTARNKKNDKFFQDYINDAWDTLGITEEQLYKTWEAIENTSEYPKGEARTCNLTKYQKLMLLEALIIETVTRAIVPTKRNEEIVAVRRRDVYLLSIGLLEGYYHTAENGTYFSAAERHQQYIQRSDFIAIMYFNSLLPDEYDIVKYQKKAKYLIAQDDKRCREFLAEYLSKEDNCRICLEEGARKHINKVIRDGQNVRYQIKLPSPCYTLENFHYVEPSKDTTDKSKDSEDYDKPKRTENTQEEDCSETPDSAVNDGNTIQQLDDTETTEDNIQEDRYTENPSSDPPNPPKPTGKVSPSIIIFRITVIVLSLSLLTVFII
ncbi:MAG: hypothetical protein K2N44_18330, partial [Lachnospiraceae bacterium]|nr:hypothetical protein [Lachnospiraceae bacterium]